MKACDQLGNSDASHAQNCTVPAVSTPQLQILSSYRGPARKAASHCKFLLIRKFSQTEFLRNFLRNKGFSPAATHRSSHAAENLPLHWLFQVISFRYCHIVPNAFHRANSEMQSQSPAPSILSAALSTLTQVIPSLVLMKQSAAVSWEERGYFGKKWLS